MSGDGQSEDAFAGDVGLRHVTAEDDDVIARDG
jgi:hypothetical protein